MLEILTPATSTRLTSLETVKEELAITGTDAERDARIERYIDAASDTVRSFTQREFARVEVRETAQAYGRPRLMLTRTPVQSVAKVLVDGGEIDDYRVEDPEAGFLWREVGWPRIARFGGDITAAPIPGTQQYDVEVTYTGGYTMPGEAGRDLPHDVEEAAILLVKAQWYRRTGDPRISSITSGKYSADWSSATYPDLPHEVHHLLKRYIREV